MRLADGLPAALEYRCEMTPAMGQMHACQRALGLPAVAWCDRDETGQTMERAHMVCDTCRASCCVAFR